MRGLVAEAGVFGEGLKLYAPLTTDTIILQDLGYCIVDFVSGDSEN